MDALECLKTRRCVRSYKPGAIDKSVIEDIVDCGRLAATGMNVQPWAFVAVTDPDILKRLAEITEYGKFIADVPCCIVVLCEDVKYFIEDGAAATMNILLAARAHGLGSCWVAGDKKEYAPRVCELLGAPENYRLLSLVPIGYAESIPTPRKKELVDVLHWERF